MTSSKAKGQTNPHAWNETIAELAGLSEVQKVIAAAYALPLKNGQPNLAAAAFRTLVEVLGTETTSGVILDGADVLNLAAQLEKHLV